MEQKYLDLIAAAHLVYSPHPYSLDEGDPAEGGASKYNINPNAGKTRLGAKHSKETRELYKKINGLTFLGKTHSDEYKAIIRERITGEKNPMFGKPVTEEMKKIISETFTFYFY